MLHTDYLVAIVAVHAAENELSEVWWFGWKIGVRFHIESFNEGFPERAAAADALQPWGPGAADVDRNTPTSMILTSLPTTKSEFSQKLVKLQTARSRLYRQLR